MKICVALLAVLLFVAPCLHAQATPTSIPYLGITGVAPSAPPSTFVFSVGQVITTVSQITSFGFYIAPIAPIAAANGSAFIAPWTGSAGTILAYTSVPLPTSGTTYQLVTATFDLENLDPTALYIIGFSFPASSAPLYTVYSSSAIGGGMVKGTYDGQTTAWSSGSCHDVVFNLASLSTLSLPYTNFADGHGSQSWACIYTCTYTAIRVNWQTMLVDTSYGVSSTSTLLFGSGSCPANIAVPYGTAAGCGYQNTHGLIDLRGTNYAVNDTFVVDGYLPNGVFTFSYANQRVDIQATGDCGFGVTVSGAAAGESASTSVGGMFLHLIRSG